MVRLTSACVLTRVDVEHIFLNDLDWKREDCYVRIRVCLSVNRTGRVCLSTWSITGGVSCKWPWSIQTAADIINMKQALHYSRFLVTPVWFTEEHLCTGEILMCHMLLYSYHLCVMIVLIIIILYHIWGEVLHLLLCWLSFGNCCLVRFLIINMVIGKT